MSKGGYLEGICQVDGCFILQMLKVFLIYGCNESKKAYHIPTSLFLLMVVLLVTQIVHAASGKEIQSPTFLFLLWRQLLLCWRKL